MYLISSSNFFINILLFSRANLGDSGCLVVRSGSIVHRTQMQQHFFNTPFQLAMLPAHSTSSDDDNPNANENNILSDAVHDCAEDRFQLQVGDLVMVATDGLFDNLADIHILKELNYLCNKVITRSLSYMLKFFRCYLKQWCEKCFLVMYAQFSTVDNFRRHFWTILLEFHRFCVSSLKLTIFSKLAFSGVPCDFWDRFLGIKR